MLCSVGHWANVIDGPLTLVHDRSTSFFKEKDLWERLLGKDVPHQVQATAGGGSVKFPLPVEETKPDDSKNRHAIQLCDVIAGLMAKSRYPEAWNDKGDLLERMRDSGWGEHAPFGITPRPEFPEGPPAKLDGPDAVDLMQAILFPGDEGATA